MDMNIRAVPSAKLLRARSSIPSIPQLVYVVYACEPYTQQLRANYYNSLRKIIAHSPTDFTWRLAMDATAAARISPSKSGPTNRASLSSATWVSYLKLAPKRWDALDDKISSHVGDEHHAFLICSAYAHYT